MIRTHLALVALLTAFIAVPAAAMGDDDIVAVLLDAHFDDKPVDVAIGTGGAEAGEPVSLAGPLSAIVRAHGNDNRLLELSGQDMPATLSAVFEFLDSVEPRFGQLHLSMKVTIPDDDYASVSIGIRPQGTNAFAFAGVQFRNTQVIVVEDPGGPAWSSAWTGTPGFQFGQPVQLDFQYDLSQARYDLAIDGVTRVSGRAHGIGQRGVGRILFILERSNEIDYGTMLVDDVTVVHTFADAIFGDGFDASVED